jgi:hypothetical protein
MSVAGSRPSSLFVYSWFHSWPALPLAQGARWGSRGSSQRRLPVPRRGSTAVRPRNPHRPKVGAVRKVVGQPSPYLRNDATCNCSARQRRSTSLRNYTSWPGYPKRAHWKGCRSTFRSRPGHTIRSRSNQRLWLVQTVNADSSLEVTAAGTGLKAHISCPEFYYQEQQSGERPYCHETA